jgi:hypothetical protein
LSLAACECIQGWGAVRALLAVPTCNRAAIHLPDRKCAAGKKPHSRHTPAGVLLWCDQ